MTKFTWKWYTSRQGGLDYTHDSGFIWLLVFNIGQPFMQILIPHLTDVKEEKKSFENDLYAGYKREKITDDLGYQIGGTVYYYYPAGNQRVMKQLSGWSYKKNFNRITAQTLLNNVTFLVIKVTPISWQLMHLN